MNDFFSSKAPSEFTKTERRIMNYILENPADFIHMSCQTLRIFRF